MDRGKKTQVSRALNALLITADNESYFVITSNRLDYIDEHIIENNGFNGKKGKKCKKGRILKDWE